MPYQNSETLSFFSLSISHPRMHTVNLKTLVLIHSKLQNKRKWDNELQHRRVGSMTITKSNVQCMRSTVNKSRTTCVPTLNQNKGFLPFHFPPAKHKDTYVNHSS
jgi:hypothetical protein